MRRIFTSACLLSFACSGGAARADDLLLPQLKVQGARAATVALAQKPKLSRIALGEGERKAARESDALPLLLLRERDRVESRGGTFALMAFSGRDAFPKLTQGIEVRPARPTAQGTLWRTPGAAHFTVAANGQTLELHTNGRAAQESRFDWLPVLTWTPRAAGFYRVSGTLELRTGQKSADTAKPDAVAWAVVKMRGDGTTEVLAQGRHADAARVALSEQAELQRVRLEKGDTLGLTVWRPAWHFGADGLVKGLEINTVG